MVTASAARPVRSARSRLTSVEKSGWVSRCEYEKQRRRRRGGDAVEEGAGTPLTKGRHAVVEGVGLVKE